MAITQSYFTGMDMDTSYSLRDQKKYYKLRNGSLTIDEELGTGTVSNSDGNVYSFELPSTIVNPSHKILPNSTEQIIIGAGTIDEYIILFSTAASGGTPLVPGGFPPYDDRDIGIIWAFKYNEETQEVIDIDLVTDPGKKLLDPDIHIVFYDRLDFKLTNPVKMIGNAESPETKKCYFVDDYNPIRYINILEEDILEKTLSHLELVEDVIFHQPTARVIAGGSFMPGVVQYAFQMFAFGGGETKFSPVSTLVNISASSYDLSSTNGFLGTEFTPSFLSEGDDTGSTDDNSGINLTAGAPTDKACKVEIHDFDRSFENMRIVRIFYDTEYATPQIDIISEIRITEFGNITFVDDGKVTLGSLTKQEFEAIGGVLFSAKDIATANNRLVAANINELYFNPDFDARAYRYNLGTSIVKDSVIPSNYYLIDALGNWAFYPGGTPTGSNWEIPEEFDSVNNDESFYNEVADGSELGGTGPNISYKFDIVEILIDDVTLNPETFGEYENTNSNRKIVERDHKAPSASNTQKWNDIFGTGFLNNYGYSNYASEINSAQLTGYQRDETYRFGIVFFDIKGRRSFVYWIGDILMPSVNESSLGKSFNITRVEYNGDQMTNTYARILYPIFEVTNTPEDAVSYQIVRVNREVSDRTIIASGVITPCARGMEVDEPNTWQPSATMLRYSLVSYDRGGPVANPPPDPNYHYTVASNSWATRFGSGNLWEYIKPGNAKTYQIYYSDRLFNLWSPEISFYKSIPSSDSYLKIIGKIRHEDSAEFLKRNSSKETNEPSDLFYKGKNITPFTTPKILSLDYRNTITKEVPFEKFNYGDATYNYKHSFSQAYKEVIGYQKITQSFRTSAGAGFVGNANSSISTELGTDVENYDIIFGYLKRDLASQYQGNSYRARKASKYIKASSIYQIAESTAYTFGGDTYIAMFEHTRHYNTEKHRGMSWDWTGDNHGQKGFFSDCVYPVESTINIDWRSDESYTRLTELKHIMKEKKGNWEADGNIFDQFPDAYLLNYSYIRPNDISLFQEEPQFFEKLVTDLSHRLMASDAKYDGEISDNWLKFKPNNILDVNGTNGEINGIQAISTYLYFFQRRGIGMTQIDERAMVNDDEGISLVLGTGDIFGKPKYISQEEGIASPFAVTKGRNGLYFYDDINKVIAAVGQEGTADLSRLKGVRSYIKNNSQNVIEPGDIDGVIAGFDMTMGMAYFTFSNPSVLQSDSFTVGYDENVGEFTSLYDFLPRVFISDYTRFITIDLETKNKGWIHGVGNKGEFYGNIYNTTLTPFITDNPSITKVFDGIEYTHDADETLGVPPNSTQTFSNIRAYNNFLDTGSNLINSKFRFRTWRAKLPRYTDPISAKSERVLGKYLKIDLEFDNSNNEPLFLQPMLTFWRPVAFIEP